MMETLVLAVIFKYSSFASGSFLIPLETLDEQTCYHRMIQGPNLSDGSVHVDINNRSIYVTIKKETYLCLKPGDPLLK